MLLILNAMVHFLDVFVARSCGIIPNYSLALCPQPVFVSFQYWDLVNTNLIWSKSEGKLGRPPTWVMVSLMLLKGGHGFPKSSEYV